MILIEESRSVHLHESNLMVTSKMRRMPNSSSKRLFRGGRVLVCLTAILLMASYFILERVAASVSPLVLGSLTSHQFDPATINGMLIVYSDAVTPECAVDYTP